MNKSPRYSSNLRILIALVGGFMISVGLSTTAFACTTCNRRVQAGIFDEHFIQNLGSILLPFVVVGLLVAAIYRMK